MKQGRKGPIVIVQTTVSKASDASHLSKAVVDLHLAACVQCSHIRSHYRWKGKVEHAEEILVAIKTRGELTGRLTKWLEANHPYETPEIVVLKPLDVARGYRDWVYAETEGGQRS